MEKLTEDEKQRRFREGYHEHRALTCDGCNERVDFSDCESIEEAREKWNRHVQDEHGAEPPESE